MGPKEIQKGPPVPAGPKRDRTWAGIRTGPGLCRLARFALRLLLILLSLNDLATARSFWDIFALHATAPEKVV